MWSRFILTDVSPRGIRYKNTSIFGRHCSSKYTAWGVYVLILARKIGLETIRKTAIEFLDAGV